VGGRQGAQASDLLGKICISAGGKLSDRTAFKVYPPQRLHAATFRGVAAMINQRPAHLAHGPRGLPWAGCITAGPRPAKADDGCFVPWESVKSVLLFAASSGLVWGSLG